MTVDILVSMHIALIKIQKTAQKGMIYILEKLTLETMINYGWNKWTQKPLWTISGQI